MKKKSQSLFNIYGLKDKHNSTNYNKMKHRTNNNLIS